ncbi:hypothetical protein RPMA_19920 [Tardiphaga alba]|uniref:Helix-turn-helix domain-containing protein n=1 Tax=Tardiphaga alba TaxID=340268 RepID=A0ABX8AAR0_9BRAD|nr:hypothetical protein [Tardiphaga alba]QUS40853.1 hypothetical protein RPMA_19920 [Tardiphaga alba]
MAHPLNPLFNNWHRVHDASEEPVLRLRIRPDVDDDGQPPIPDRPKGSKRLHTNATVATTRRLIEETTLSYKQIAQRTGATHGTVGRWAREFGWKRHPFAARATDTVPTARAGRRLKLRMLGVKLQEVAERCVNELWASPTVDYERLIKAMEAFKVARLMAMGSRRPRRHPEPRARTGQDWLDRDAAIAKGAEGPALGRRQYRAHPEEAMALLEDAHTPPEDHPALRPRIARGPRRRK